MLKSNFHFYDREVNSNMKPLLNKTAKSKTGNKLIRLI